MFKKILVIIIVLGSINLGFANNYTWDDNTKQIYTQNKDNVINDNGLDDPIRNGTKSSAGGLEGVNNTDTSSQDNRQKGFIDYIAVWVNYILGFLGLIIIIFIIKDGIIMVSFAGNEEKKKEAFKNLKNYIIAIILIGTAYLIVNLVFNFMNKNT